MMNKHRLKAGIMAYLTYHPIEQRWELDSFSFDKAILYPDWVMVTETDSEGKKWSSWIPIRNVSEINERGKR